MTRTLRFAVFCLCVLSLLPLGSHANNLVVGGGSRLSAPNTDKITFTLSWDNSWMVGGTPGNHDAVWVFVKIRECGVGGAWTHALLDTAMGSHTFGASVTYAQPVSLKNRLGALPAGTTLSNGLGNNTGMLIRRNTLGTGSIVSAACTLRIVNPTVAFDPAKTYDIRVFGIEMVQVMNEGFTLGDGISTNTFTLQNVSSETANIAAGTLFTGSLAVPDSFPKGVNGFYCMKYEISQGQYGQFMNSANGLVGSPALYSGQNRNQLQAGGPTPNDMWSPNEDRAQNFMGWNDLLAYLDWAALRPMTEMEYEKVCKGPLGAVGGGYAWGNTSYTPTWLLSGTEDGTEYVHTKNANVHCFIPGYYDYYDNIGGALPAGWLYLGGYYTVNGQWFRWSLMNNTSSNSPPQTSVPACAGSYCQYYYAYAVPVMLKGSFVGQGFGPVGCGIYARDTTLTRATTGAGYYGAMELSGNVWEQCVNVSAQSYSGRWGNGYLSASGLADVVGWPGGANGNPAAGRALRGGGYDTDPSTAANNNLRVADRQYWNNTDWSRDGAAFGYYAATYRRGGFGGRGVR